MTGWIGYSRRGGIRPWAHAAGLLVLLAISLIVLLAICHSSPVPRPREEAEKGGRPAAATLDKILAFASRERRSTSPVRVLLLRTPTPPSLVPTHVLETAPQRAVIPGLTQVVAVGEQGRRGLHGGGEAGDWRWGKVQRVTAWRRDRRWMDLAAGHRSPVGKAVRREARVLDGSGRRAQITSWQNSTKRGKGAEQQQFHLHPERIITSSRSLMNQ